MSDYEMTFRKVKINFNKELSDENEKPLTDKEIVDKKEVETKLTMKKVACLALTSQKTDAMGQLEVVSLKESFRRQSLKQLIARTKAGTVELENDDATFICESVVKYMHQAIAGPFLWAFEEQNKKQADKEEEKK